MATKKSTVDKKALKADIIRVKNAKSEEDVDKIMAKYDDALKDMDKKKAAPAKKAAPKKETAKKDAPKADAKKTATKAAAAKAPAAKKEKEAPKGRSYNGKYEVYHTGDAWQYHLKASNGEILFVSETYTTRDGVIKGIDACQRKS